ncbi:hypothetical protein [Streptomyces sp. NPDC101165]|uniref:hypothetical protein n=1 Tax=Streptomyces sp. NPDC101165 TaxID=3366119 RepID=UPI00380E5D04
MTDVHLIAAAIRRFAGVAVQEARGNRPTLRHLLKVLGDDGGARPRRALQHSF